MNTRSSTSATSEPDPASPWARRLAEWLGRPLAALWAGGLWTIGYVVAPTLFARLDDRHLAGEIAGWLFERVAQLGLACGLILIGLALAMEGRRAVRARAFWVVVAMLILALIQWQWLQPWMREIKAAGEVTASAFGRLHAISSVLYLIQSILALPMLTAATGRRAC
ncbi:MAG: DUF4149 domain-containing protein [Rhodocyclaceae bacterium]|nr:DUF4149 domain-containing protein [Rhodocyclaceae bacterium]